MTITEIRQKDKMVLIKCANDYDYNTVAFKLDFFNVRAVKVGLLNFEMTYLSDTMPANMRMALDSIREFIKVKG